MDNNTYITMALTDNNHNDVSTHFTHTVKIIISTLCDILTQRQTLEISSFFFFWVGCFVSNKKAVFLSVSLKSSNLCYSCIEQFS